MEMVFPPIQTPQDRPSKQASIEQASRDLSNPTARQCQCQSTSLRCQSKREKRVSSSEPQGRTPPEWPPLGIPAVLKLSPLSKGLEPNKKNDRQGNAQNLPVLKSSSLGRDGPRNKTQPT
ncbi:hypothetical protein TEQG_05624 [Trichophyton equinum CBS 127.97]|uniref:Uncharacterized protein n=1 Tax=Trichophyton equinum (strain ATCC MYA-4606 / CBS 127.97) TaxID=559882 RepID=F2PXK8_TRIEC|nr:hypothetical protein TEQG_05624 [Trichophyton equinum CBS 127.97]